MLGSAFVRKKVRDAAVDTVCGTDAVDDVRAKEAAARSGAVLGRSAKAMPLSVSTVWIR